MTVTAAYMISRFPGVFDNLFSTSPTAVNDAITSAYNQLNPIVWGPNIDEAALYLAAHFAELSKLGRAGGQNRAKAGQVEMDWGGPGQSQETSFLRLFNQMKKRLILPISVAT